MKKIGVGLIGLGGIADFHYQGLKGNDSVTLLGIADANKEILRKRIDEWKVIVYNSIDEILEVEEIDAVHILTPSDKHFEHVIKALEAGKHVLVEKPVATSLKEIENIKDVAEKKNLICLPNHNHLYTAGIIEARKLIDEEKLGKIVYGEFFASGLLNLDNWGWRASLKSAGGGALIDSGTHLIYQALYLLGSCNKVKAMTKKFFCKIEGEDTAAVLLEHDSGAISCIVQSWASKDYFQTPEVKILGTKGQLWIGNSLYENRGLYFNGEKILDGWPIETTFTKAIDDFYNAIQGKRQPLSNLEQSSETLKIVQKAYENCLRKS